VKSSEILISGAGVAGPVLAYWLSRHGFRSIVVQRASALRDGGYKVDVRGAATAVLGRMGLLADAHRASADIRDVAFLDRAGRPIATLDADLIMGRQGDDVELMRGDLIRLLYDASRHDAEYLFGDSIVALEQDDGGVHVAFERGRPRTFDLVVGADGLHSTVRALTFGDESAFIHHLGCYLAIYTVPNHLGLDRRELFYSAPGQLANVYSARQRREAKALFAFNSEPLAYDRRDVGQQKRILAAAFAGQGWEVPRLLEAMSDAPDFYFDSVSQVRLDRWSRGRVVLVGDAGYSPSPASGQGTSLALVGAYVLAGELKAAGGDQRAAFARYEQAMRSFVERNQALGQKMAREMVPATRGQLWLRTQTLRLLPYVPWKGPVTRGIQRPIYEAANAISLQEYAVDVHGGPEFGARPEVTATTAGVNRHEPLGRHGDIGRAS
jgi:2-polyprenyl-6-methoxyphenol hydroxylase-like FAD-dependent oxidoreductase